MITKQKVFLIIAVVLIIVFGISNLSRLIPEDLNYKNYETALSEYNSNDFSEAYHTFGKVSKFSKLKSAAIYRQAVCAGKLGDKRTETNKYKDVIRLYPHSVLAVKAQYLKAQNDYSDKKFNRAKKEFKSLIGNGSTSDYAIASNYYLGLIEAEKSKTTTNKKKKLKKQNKAIQYFKTYLKEAPTGKYAMNSIENWLSLGHKLNNEDNLLIVNVYQANHDYNNAKKFLQYTNISVSWPYFVKNAYAKNDFSQVKYYTVQGLKGRNPNEILINESIDEKTENENAYEAIDDYLKTSLNPKMSISYLLSIANKTTGYEYLLYKNCNNMAVEKQTACYNSLIYQYPKGQFAAESLSNIFYSQIKDKKYYVAQKLGRMHLSKYPNSNSTPRVIFWLAKVAERTKNYEGARSYYKTLIRQYPDDYYAYRAFLNLNRLRYFETINLVQKPVKFPYEHSQYGIIMELTKVKDYGLLNQISTDDKFIQSWLSYLQGDYASSARTARDAMAKLTSKPDRLDPRWRLVYPIHYYDDIKQSARSINNDPIILLSIIREESYFNPKAKSPVGARGLMQLMPGTALEAANASGISLPNMSLLYDPYINIKLGNIYYSRLKKMLGQKDVLAVLAYNGGGGSVSTWTKSLNYYDVDDFIEQIPYSETKNYLKKVYKSYWNYLRIYDGIK